MTLYKGEVIDFFWSKYMHRPRNYAPVNPSQDSAEHDWVKGSILLIIATLAWASFFILQVINQTTQTLTTPIPIYFIQLKLI